MTVLEFVKKNEYVIISCANTAARKDITGVYTCDLLSKAMAALEAGDMWITVHTNVNIVAVASLANVSCVVIPESIPVEELTVKKAEEHGIILVGAPHTGYEICTRYFVQSGGSGHD